MVGIFYETRHNHWRSIIIKAVNDRYTGLDPMTIFALNWVCS